MTTHIGIDPGLDGGLVALDSSLQVVEATRMPTLGTGKRLLDIVQIRTWLFDVRAGRDVRVWLEKSGPRPKDGKAAAWKTGCGWGQLEGLLCGLAMPYQVVPPRTWQADVCKGLPKLDTKARTVLAVQRRLPALDLTPGRCRVPHTGLADAAGLAMYGVSQ